MVDLFNIHGQLANYFGTLDTGILKFVGGALNFKTDGQDLSENLDDVTEKTRNKCEISIISLDCELGQLCEIHSEVILKIIDENIGHDNDDLL